MIRTYVLTLLLFVAGAYKTIAQDRNEFFYGHIGYQNGLYQQDQRQFTGNNTESVSGQLDLSWNRMGWSFEAARSFYYIHWDLAMMSDFVKSLFAENDYVADIHLPRVGFGGFLTDWFALYGGGQYSYSYMETGSSNPNIFFGGNQRGFGGHALLSTQSVKLRASYMYDWIRVFRQSWKGRATTYDVMLMVTPFGDGNWGFHAGYSLRNREMDPTNTTTDSRWAHEVDYVNRSESRDLSLPAMSGTDRHWRVGFTLQGYALLKALSFGSDQQETITIEVID